MGLANLDAQSKSKSEIVAELSKVDWNFPESNTARSIHNIHPYPAKFIPEIPRTLIEILDPPANSIVFDPFCGSGVTLYEANKSGLNAFGIDLNPIACLISRVKTREISRNLLTVAQEVVWEANSKLDAAAIPDIPNLDHWFQPNVQSELAALRVSIEDADLNNADKEALNLALSAIIVRVSNQDSDTRYAARDKKVQTGDASSLFLKSVERIVSASLAVSGESTVVQSNILDVGPEQLPNNIGLVVTSPPYPNAYEYWLYHKYRMYWLDFDPIEVKNKEIGARAHYFKKNAPTASDFENQMSHVASICKEAMLPGAFACFVVGRSVVRGQTIDNAEIVRSAAGRVGLAEIASPVRQINSNRKSFNLSHANIKSETLLVFQKPL